MSQYSQNPSGFLALNVGTRHFSVPGIDGFVAYRPIGRRYWVQFAGPCAAVHEQHALWVAFRAAADAAGRRVIAAQLLAREARLAAATGCTVTQLGASYSIELARFSLRGKAFVKTRNMIARSRREGVTVAEVGIDIPAADVDSAELAALDRKWLRDKGWHVRELALMVGERGGPYDERRRLFLALKHGRVVAYVSWSPVFGDRAGWLYDLTRRLPDAPPGVIEHVFVEAAQRMAAEGAGWLHLGFTPFVGLDDAARIGDAHSPALGALIGWIGRKAPWLYPAAGQVAFKLKWAPHLVTPEYLALPGRPRLRDVLSFAAATNAF